MGTAIGLQVAKHECQVFPHSGEATQSLGKLPGMPRVVSGIVADEQIVRGSDVFVSKYAHSKVDDTEKKMKCMLGLPIPLQDKVLLLRKLEETCESDLLCTSEGALTRVARQSLDQVMLSAMCKIMHCERGQVDQRELLLPVRLGCGGIVELPYLHGELACDAAYLAAAAHAQEMGAAGPSRFHPFAGSSGDKMHAKWQHLMPALGGWSLQQNTTLCLPNKENVDAVLRAVVEETQDVSHRDLLESVMHAISNSPSLEQVVRDKSTAARVRSLLHPCATAWLNVLPSSPTTRLDDEDFVPALWHHFGVVLPQAHSQQAVRCKCGADMHQATPGHTMACKAFSKGWHTRQDVIAEAWCIFIERAGFNTSLEPLVRDSVPGGIEKKQDNYGKRGDILFEMEGGAVIVDESVAHVSSSGQSSQTWKRSGAAATDKRKRGRKSRFQATMSSYLYPWRRMVHLENLLRS